MAEGAQPTIEVVPFTKLSELLRIGESKQLHYLFDYLTEMGARTVLIENAYFDRDYLSEFAAFYSVSSRSYANLCRRLHFFEEPEVTVSDFQKALGGDGVVLKRMQDSYLGFIVQRPLVHAPLGRTALKWYPDRNKATPRITNPSRTYEVHVAGLSFSVESVAWQQQDRGVGSCATVGMWSMLHSSALDEFHAIPTTAEITLVGSDHTPMGRRAFPSTGLTMAQLCEVIKQQDLAPLIFEGDFIGENGVPEAFSPSLFAASVASLIRSDYPVLIGGKLDGQGQHAVCAVGFREVASNRRSRKSVQLQDEQTEYFFLHDDNLGPNVRFNLGFAPTKLLGRTVHVATLKAEAPERRFKTSRPSATADYPTFIPRQIVAAAHQDVRSTPGELLKSSRQIAERFVATAKFQSSPAMRVTVSGRFFLLSNYLGKELGRVLARHPSVLAATRLALVNGVRPMSLHIGVGRIGLASDATPLVDVLYDTTDCQLEHSIFCCVSYNSFSQKILQQLQKISAMPDVPIIFAF